jgi:hypothetical protein
LANTTIKQNRTTITEPSLQDLFNLWKKQIFLNLNCMHIGTIKSFDPVTQTCTATVNYKKTFFKKDDTGVYQPVLKDYPLLADVPVIILSGGGASLTMPIAVGDECILLFNDRDIDNWFQSGQITGNATARLHSFADAFALVGVRSSPNSLFNYDSERASLNNGTTRVAVGAEKILIENELTTLNTQLQSLLTQLTNLTAALATLTVTGVTGGGGNSGVPANAAAITAIGTNLATIAGNIGSLLE